MNTTNLFVELIVIGAGAVFWIGCFACAVLGLPAGRSLGDLLEPAVLVALVPLVYVLGIVTDRVADGLCERLWGTRLYRAIHEEQLATRQDLDSVEARRTEFFARRRLLMLDGGSLFTKLEYTRSRLRISRGWALNAALAAPAALACAWRFAGAVRGWLVAAAVLMAALAIVCWWVWRDLETEYVKKVLRQGEWIAERKAASPEGGVAGAGD